MYSLIQFLIILSIQVDLLFRIYFYLLEITLVYYKKECLLTLSICFDTTRTWKMYWIVTRKELLKEQQK